MSTTAEYVLTYFPIRGRAEHIRLLLEDCKIPYRQNLIANENWKQLKARGPETGEIPFAQLPVLHEPGTSLYLAQSGAIARHLARRHHKYGQNELEASLADMLYDTASDIRQVYRDFIFDENWQAKRESFVSNASNRFSLLEKFVSSRNTPYLVGQDTTFADYHLLEVIHIIQRVQSDIIRPYSWLQSFCQKMESRPNIAEYLKSSRRFEKPVPLPHA
jgi:glutathione S-transferase